MFTTLHGTPYHAATITRVFQASGNGHRPPHSRIGPELATVASEMWGEERNPASGPSGWGCASPQKHPYPAARTRRLEPPSGGRGREVIAGLSEAIFTPSG